MGVINPQVNKQYKYSMMAVYLETAQRS